MRIWEIDFLRGLAVLLMVTFHFIVDLRDFYGFPLDYRDGFCFILGKSSACLFILCAGISTRFSRSPLRHGLKVLTWGMVLSIVTYFYDPAIYIRFGILHLLGVSLLLSAFFSRFTSLQLTFIALSLLLLGNFWEGAAWLRQPWLIPLGYPPASFATLDYYPLLPWLGLFVLGMILGRQLYPRPLSRLPNDLPHTPLNWCGRNALAIYLLHQPILLLLLFFFFN